jgi:hypothetical protein
MTLASPARSSRNARLAGISAVAALATLVVVVQGPILRTFDEYAFADQRALLGLPHALNVLSNLPFAWVGWLGWRRARALEPAQRRAARLTFLAIASVTLGSSWYHLAPAPERLLLDRLSITLAFATLTAWVLGDRLGERWGRVTLVPLVALSLAALFTWFGEGDGGGDLRGYVLTQLLPLLVVPLLLLSFPGALETRRFAWALALYGLAKLCELLDAELYAFGGVASGHTLKHLLAAAACACFVPRAAAHALTRRSAWCAPNTARPSAAQPSHKTRGPACS